MKKSPLAVILSVALAACGQPLPKKGDYWLELKNTFGDWEKTALITGYMDDYEACNEFLQALNEWNEKNTSFPREYRCTAA